MRRNQIANVEWLVAHAKAAKIAMLEMRELLGEEKGGKLMDPLIAGIEVYIEQGEQFRTRDNLDYDEATTLVGELRSSLEYLKVIIEEKLSEIKEVDTRGWIEYISQESGASPPSQIKKEKLIKVLEDLKRESLSSLNITKPATVTTAPTERPAPPTERRMPPPVPPKPVHSPRPDKNTEPKKTRSDSESDQAPNQTTSWKKSQSTPTYPDQLRGAYDIKDVICRIEDWLKLQKKTIVKQLIKTGNNGIKEIAELPALIKYFKSLSKQISDAEKEPNEIVREKTLQVILATHKDKIEKTEQRLCTLLEKESWTAPKQEDNTPKITK